MKLAIITGADGGMGYEETKAVALKGYHTIMACYCPKRAEEKCAKLIQETGNSNIEIIGIDLANLASVRQFAEKVKSRFQRVDLLMNNAGTMETGYHYTVDGLERTISVNYVGPYLLSRLLLPLMGKGSRIVNMASLVYPLGRLNFPQFFERGMKGWWWRIFPYFNSKLAITLFTIELASGSTLLQTSSSGPLSVRHARGQIRQSTFCLMKTKLNKRALSIVPTTFST